MTENLREGHFFRVLKDKATDTWDRLSFWTKARDVEFNDGRNLEERLPFDFAIDSSGNYGYKKMGADTVTPFRNPVGDATAADVLQGKVFSNAYSDNVTGTMTNRGNINQNLNPGGSITLQNGYYSGGTIRANSNTETYTFGSGDGTTVDMGINNVNRYANAQNVYRYGYDNGYAAGKNEAQTIYSGVQIYKVASLKIYPTNNGSPPAPPVPTINAYPVSAPPKLELSPPSWLYENMDFTIIDNNANYTTTVNGLTITGFNTDSTIDSQSFFIYPTDPYVAWNTIISSANDGACYQPLTVAKFNRDRGELNCYYGMAYYNVFSGFSPPVPLSFDVYVVIQNDSQGWHFDKVDRLPVPTT